MRRSVIVAFAVVATLLAVTAMPAQAANVAVVSEHETFGTGSGEPNPQTLADMTVSGGGTTATVENTDTQATASTDAPLGNTQTDTADTGLQFTANRPIDEITVTTALVASPQPSRVLVKSGTGNTVLGTGSISSRTGTVSGLNLQAGTQYRVVVDRQGSSYNYKSYNNGGSHASSSLLTVDSGVDGGTAVPKFVYSIQDLEAASPDEGDYLSAEHDASTVTEAFTDFSTIDGGSATVDWQYYDGNNWQTATTNTYSTAGNKTVSLSASADRWRVEITTSRSGASHDVVLEREGVLASTESPTLSGPDPTGNISSYDGDVSINVSDPDFGEAHGDSVTVSVEDSGGNQIGSETVTSNRTVTVSYVAKANDNNLTWSASDSYGGAATASHDFDGPTFLSVRNESAPNELVNTSSNVTATFFAQGNETVVEKSSTDGRFDFTGLPATKRYIVSVNAKGYRQRQVIIDSLFEQQSVYLLPENASSVESRFVLNDPTGEFDSETIIYVEKPIQTNNTTKYRTVVADRFGVEGVTATLAQDARYRIVIEGADGTVQEIGPYRADVSEEVTVEPGTPTIELGAYEGGWTADAAVTGDDQSGRQIEYRYVDPVGETDSLTIYVHEAGNTSNQLAANDTYATVGNVSGTYNLTANESNTTWAVNFIADRDGETLRTQVLVSKRPNITPGLDGVWTQIAGVGMLLIFAGVFSILNRGVGAVVTAVTGGVLWFTGWLPGVTAGAAVVIAIFVAVIYATYTTSAPG